MCSTQLLDLFMGYSMGHNMEVREEQFTTFQIYSQQSSQQ